MQLASATLFGLRFPLLLLCFVFDSGVVLLKRPLRLASSESTVRCEWGASEVEEGDCSTHAGEPCIIDVILRECFFFSRKCISGVEEALELEFSSRGAA